MAVFIRWSSFRQVLKISNNHLFTKISPSASFLEAHKHCIHTEHVAAEISLSNDKAKDERQNFIAAPVPHEEVVTRLLKCSSMKEQLLMLPSILGLTAADIKQRHSIAEMVEDMLKPFFHVCKVHIFGSSVNSFGFKGCDIDMALEVEVKNKDLKAVANDDSEIPTIEDVLSGKVSPMYMTTLSSTDKLIFIHTVFLDYYKESTVAPIYIGAYIPLIRFYHDFHQMKIDLTCSNRHALLNTKLLHLYGQLDERVIPLVMAVRYWAKNAGLIGGSLMFNSYCLTLLMIFFLQRRHPPVLPTFDQILSLSDNIMLEDMQDTSYLEVLKKIPPSSNNESIDALFKEFFYFYFYFDFGDVICPGTGQAVPRSDFSDAVYSKKFKYNTICVQDPIKLTHNVANLVDYKHCKKFAWEMLDACDLFQGNIIPPNGLWGLPALFGSKNGSRFLTEDTFSLKLPLDQVVAKGHGSSENALLQRAAETVVNIFREALFFHVSEKQEGRTELVNNSLRIGEETLLFCHKLSGNNNTWLGRSNHHPTEVSVLASEDPLGFEKALSLKLLQRVEKAKMQSQQIADDRKCEFQFFCKFFGVKEENKLVLILKMAPAKGTRFNPILKVFLADYIPRLMEKLL